MKKIFRYLALLASLSLHAAAWGDMADNGVECSVVMEKTRFDARETFPDFKLVFTNKGEAPRHNCCGGTGILDPLHCGYLPVQGRQNHSPLPQRRKRACPDSG